MIEEAQELMGAYISRRLAKDEPRTAVRYAIAAAVTTIEKDAVRRRSLKDEEIRESISGMTGTTVIWKCPAPRNSGAFLCRFQKAEGACERAVNVLKKI